ENTHKWDKIFFVAPLFAFIIFGYVLAGISGNVLFVKRIGVEFLPYTYVANALFGTVAALFVAGSIGKHSVAKLIQVIAGLGAIIFFGTFLLIQEDIWWGYPILLIFGQILYMLLGAIIMWDLGLKICTPLEAKRTFSFFSLGASVGGIIAGTVSSLITETYGTEILIPIVIGSLALVALNAVLIQFFYHDKLAPSADADEMSHWESIKNGFLYYRKSKLARMLSFVLILFFSVRWIGDYEFQKILGDTFTEDEFSKVSGYVSIVENAILIVMFLFVQRFIIGRLGVLNTLLASPAFVLVPFFILFFFPVYLVVTGVKVFTKVINYSTFSSSIRLMFTAIPHGIRSSVTTFIGGNSESAGMLLAGAGLLILTNLLANEWIIAIGIGLCLFMILVVIFIKREYIKQIVHNLEATDLEDLHSAIENLAEPAYHELGVNELMKMVQRENLDVETVRKIIFSLGKIDNVNVIPSLIDFFRKYDITVKYAVIEAIHSFKNLNERLGDLPFTRFNLIDAYQEIFLHEEDPELKVFILKHLRDFDPDNVIKFLKEAIEKQDSAVQYQAIKAMKYFHDRGIIQYVKPFLDDERAMVRASSIIALWQFTELRPQLMKRFVEMMMKPDKDSVLSIFLIISKVGITWEAKYVRDKLLDKDAQVQTMAALTLLEIDDYKGLHLTIENLIKQTPFSAIVARNIKDLSPKTKRRLLELIRRKDELSIQTCIANLKSTYLNFGEEIEFLTSEKSNLTTFTGRVSMEKKIVKKQQTVLQPEAAI
ncbi:MAG: HEAT repeat domain-containing protein, partial [Candidatus Peregrinibacteria bacterium]|nr:HEAT repeat domain-containing protein [Candidatus Peregrinibacteria bacterium]